MMLKKECAWCQAKQGEEVEGLESRITYGICQSCCTKEYWFLPGQFLETGDD